MGAFEEIYAVPRTGGEEVAIYPPEGVKPSIYPAFWIRGENLLVGIRDEIRVLPRLGGAIEETITLPHPFSTNLNSTSDAFLDADGKTLFGKYDPIIADGTTPEITYFSYDLEAGTSVTILEGTEIGHIELMVRHGEYLYTAHSTDRSIGSTAPDELYRIPIAGGDPEKIPVDMEMRMEMVGAADGYLYLYGMELPIDAGERPASLYRVPLAGGLQERLVITHPTVRMLRDFVERDDHVVFSSLNDVYRIDKASGEATRIASSRCLAAIAVDEGEVFLALQPKDEDAVMIARVSY